MPKKWAGIGAGVLVACLAAEWQAWTEYRNNGQNLENAFDTRIGGVDESLASTGDYSIAIHGKMQTLIAYAQRHEIGDVQKAQLAQRIAQENKRCVLTKQPSLQALCKERDYSIAEFNSFGNNTLWQRSLATYGEWPLGGLNACRPAVGRPFTLFTIYSESQQSNALNCQLPHGGMGARGYQSTSCCGVPGTIFRMKRRS